MFNLEEYLVKNNRFVFKRFLLNGAFAALLLCGGVSLLPAQTGQAVTTLDEIVVTANRAEESRREVASNVTVISEDDIAASTASTLADLAVEYGLQVYTTGDNSNVYIRGYGSGSMASEVSNSLLILINGRRVGTANLALVGLANIKRVEIIRGPAAVQYGPAAMGGVINVITKQGMDSSYISVETGIGSDALHRERISFGGTGGGFDFALGLTNHGRDDVTTSGGRRWYHTEIDHNTALNADLGYTIADIHRAGVNFNYGVIASTLPRNGIRPYERNTPDALYGFGKYEKSNQNIALNYAGHAKEKTFDWSTSYSFGSDDRDYSSSATPYTITVENRIFNAQTGYTAKLFSFSAGVDYLRYKTLPYTTTTESIMRDTGIYFTGRLRLFDERLIFSAGGRYDAYYGKGTVSEQDYDNFGGSVGAAYLPVKGLKLRANYAEGFKVPTIAQMSGNGTTTAPNPDLRPEKSKTVEFGTDISRNFIDASLTYFHSKWKDKIFSARIADTNPTNQNQNLKSSTLAGLEGSLRADIGKAFRQDYGLTPYLEFTMLGTRRNEDEDQFLNAANFVRYSDPEVFEYKGTPIDLLKYTPKLMVSYGLDYKNPALKLKTRLSVNRYGEVVTDDFDYFSPTYGYTRRSPLLLRPAGTVVNLSAERELARFRERGGALILRTEINNLFDGQNEMYWSYPGAGRSFYVGLRYDLD